MPHASLHLSNVLPVLLRHITSILSINLALFPVQHRTTSTEVCVHCANLHAIAVTPYLILAHHAAAL